MWCVLFGGGGEDVLIPIEVYSVYIRGPPIQKFGDGTDHKVGITKERPRGRAYGKVEVEVVAVSKRSSALMLSSF
jgi:hypothetical protein